jgi:hypothetical protein
MPAPQAQMMQQLARVKFMSFGLKAPPNWQAPVGEVNEKHYRDAFKPEERNTQPGTPPLFLPASMNKYHTDAQKMLIAKVGAFIDGTCSAICQAWSTWQSSATMTGIIVNAITATGGQIIGPPLTPIILASGPKSSQANLRYTNVIASVIGTAWQTFTATVKIPGLPLYPAFALFPGPMAPPTPNVPVPFAALTQVPVSISATMLKSQMVAQLGDPTAPFMGQLFECISDAFEKTYNMWKLSTMVTNVLGTGAIPTFIPPLFPPGPVVMGMATMAPGGFA